MHELLGEDRPAFELRDAHAADDAGAAAEFFEAAFARDSPAKARVDDDDEPGFLVCGAFIGGSDGFCPAPTQDAAT